MNIFPKQIEKEGVLIVINYFKTHFNPNISAVSNSDGFDLTVAPPADFVRDIVRENRIHVDFCVIAKSPSLDEAALACVVRALLSAKEPITETKHFWNLLDECLICIQDEIKENNIVDKDGQLISIGDKNNFAPSQFDGWI